MAWESELGVQRLEDKEEKMVKHASWKRIVLMLGLAAVAGLAIAGGIAVAANDNAGVNGSTKQIAGRVGEDAGTFPSAPYTAERLSTGLYKVSFPPGSWKPANDGASVPVPVLTSANLAVTAVATRSFSVGKDGSWAFAAHFESGGQKKNTDFFFVVTQN
jgi:hypothetical protein